MTKPRDLLPAAMRQLLDTREDVEDETWRRLASNPDTHQHLAKLLKAIHRDWCTAGDLRNLYAGGDHPASPAETAAVALARIILNQPEPTKNHVPPMHELLDGCAENHQGRPT